VRDHIRGFLQECDLLLVDAQVVFIRHILQLIVDVVLRLVYQISERVCALGLYILVRVLCTAHRQHLDLKIELFKKPDGALRGFFACAVVIIGDDDLVRVMRDQPRLLGRERGAERRDRAVKTGLVHHHDVNVALSKYYMSALRLFSQIKRKKIAAFVEHHRFRAVHILRLAVAEYSAGKADEIAPDVDDGEHEPVAEGVVVSAVFALADKSGVEHLIFRVAERLHRVYEAVPCVRRVAEAEALCRMRRYLTPCHVVKRRLALGLAET